MTAAFMIRSYNIILGATIHIAAPCSFLVNTNIMVISLPCLPNLIQYYILSVSLHKGDLSN